MRLFYFIKAAQCLIAYAVILLFMLNSKICGKSSLDKLLSNPNASCSKSLQSIYMNTFTSARHNVWHDKSDTSKTTSTSPVVDGNKQPNKRMPREANEKVQNAEVSLRKKRSKIVSFSCIDISVKDATCFVRNYEQRHTICDALTGVVITPLIMFVEIIVLVYTMVSVGCSNFIPSEKTDRLRALINSIIWFSSIIVVCYLLGTWKMSWMNFDFTPHTPTQWLIALALLFVGLASIGLELFFEEKLYMSVKTVSQSDNDFTVNEKDGIEMPVRTIRSSIHARYAEISETIPARKQQISYNSAVC